MGTAAEHVAEKLAWEVESRTAIEVRVRTEISNLNPKQGPQFFHATLEHYIETQTGQRLFEYKFVGAKDQVVRLETHYADGTRFADVYYKGDDIKVQDRIDINQQFFRESKSDFKMLPNPLRYFHVGREPLQKAVLKAEELGPSKVMGRDCDQFLFPQVHWPVPQDQVFSIDRQTGVPLKVEAYRDAAARAKGERMWIWEVESLNTTEGRHLPAKSTQTDYGPGQKPMLVTSTILESVEYNKDYPATMFWPKEEPGVTVFDTVADTITKVPGTTTTAPPNPSSPIATSASTARPIEAIPPTDSTPTYLFGAGLIVLLAGGILWWRRR